MRATVALERCERYEPVLVQKALGRALASLGGIEKFVRPSGTVLVKPNLLMAQGPDSGVVTHPEVVRAAVRVLKGIGCRVLVGDSPSVWGKHIERVDQVYQISGIKRVCEEEGAELVVFEKRRWHGRFPLTVWLDECDALLNLPKFKTHGLTTLTAAVKNLFGLVPGTYKTELHKHHYRGEDFSRSLVDLFDAVRPALTIVDGIVALEGDGPGSSGTPRTTGLIVAGSDCVAVDAVLARIMGLAPEAVATTREAAARGLGCAREEEIAILGERLATVCGKPFKLPATSLKQNLPKPVVDLIFKFLRFYPYCLTQRCVRCGACVKACPEKVITMQARGLHFEYNRCIACFCCQEVCPQAAIKVKKSFLARCAGL